MVVDDEDADHRLHPPCRIAPTAAARADDASCRPGRPISSSRRRSPRPAPACCPARPRRGRGAGVPRAVVGDLHDAARRRPAADRTHAWRAPACRTDVGQRLLDDPVGRHLDRRGQAGGSATSTSTSRRVPAVSRVGQLLERADQAEVVERRRPQTLDDPADVEHRVPGCRARRSQQVGVDLGPRPSPVAQRRRPAGSARPAPGRGRRAGRGAAARAPPRGPAPAVPAPSRTDGQQRRRVDDAAELARPRRRAAPGRAPADAPPRPAQRADRRAVRRQRQLVGIAVRGRRQPARGRPERSVIST